MSLDSFAASQIKDAMKNGFATTPKYNEQPTEEERSDIIERIGRVLAMAYTNNPGHPEKWILHWKTIWFRVAELIDKEINLGIWNHKKPEIETVRRNVNYSADVRRYKDSLPTSICVKAGFYCLNVATYLDSETKAKLEDAIRNLK